MLGSIGNTHIYFWPNIPTKHVGRVQSRKFEIEFNF